MLEYIQYVRKFESALDEYICYPSSDNWRTLIELKEIVHYLSYSQVLNQKKFIPGEPISLSLN